MKTKSPHLSDATPAIDDRYSTDELRWQAVAGRDRQADGAFFYSVKTTGVYCRPSCAARRAKRENVRFHRTATEAEKAGFRACRRCQPNKHSAVEHHAAAVAKACKRIALAGESLDLKTLAGAVGMSPSHFHRVFKSLTGLTPKAYATAQCSQRMRNQLSQSETVAAAIHSAGFNSNGRFYATSPKVLGMTPATFRAGGQGAVIQFALGQCSLGSILVAASSLGICSIALADDPSALVRDLEDRFPKADLTACDRDFETLLAQVIAFVERPAAGLDLPLDVQGTAFQQRIWQLLCEIPCGQTTTYAQIAQRIGDPQAARAVAQACAANRLAVAIPCHRVVRTDGSLSGYRWGIERKEKLLRRERTQCSQDAT